MSQVRGEPSAAVPISPTITFPKVPIGATAKQDASQQLTYNNDVVEERRYGCYRLGVVAAVVIILILIAGTVPFVFVVNNRQIVLLATCVTLVVVAILLFIYTSCQTRAVRKQRYQFNREPQIDRQHNIWHYTSVTTTPANVIHHGTASWQHFDKHHNRVTTPTSWAFRTASCSKDYTRVQAPTSHSPGDYLNDRSLDIDGHTNLPSRIMPFQQSKHTLID